MPAGRGGARDAVGAGAVQNTFLPLSSCSMRAKSPGRVLLTHVRITSSSISLTCAAVQAAG
jgi:hypothetical protein